jgi:hypothetical protein
MIRIQDRLVCAWISLMIEKHHIEKNYELKNVLFSADEVVGRAKALFPNDSEAKEADIRKATAGSSYTEYNKYFISEPFDSVGLYCMLSGQTVYQEGEITSFLSNMVRVLLNQAAWVSKPENASTQTIEEIIRAYFQSTSDIKAISQKELPELSTLEAIWIAAATLAYNEYYRTGSDNQENYAFDPATIKDLAHTYNKTKTPSSLSQMATKNCVHGKNEQSHSYLIPAGNTGSRRRASYYGEAMDTQPAFLHRDFVVATINGEKTVGDIEQFIKEIYPAAIRWSPLSEEIIDADIISGTDYEESYDPSLFSDQDFLDEIYMSAEDYWKVKKALEYNKNIILCGAPGVGKSYAASFLAYSVMRRQGPEADERIMKVQFHQSYSYEDFIEGLRPTVNGRFDPEKGAFTRFCEKAALDPDNNYFFIIDEINRGNLSRIFGELFTLIEDSKREREYMPLLYSKEPFTVPKNLYIIGMMNTADRSLAILDYALRRRFAFINLKPGFETEQFRAYQAELNNSAFDRVIKVVRDLNSEIKNDPALGVNYLIGHSYFCRYNELFETAERQEKLLSTIEYSIIPMLQEYWFDNPERAANWGEKLMHAARG